MIQMHSVFGLQRPQLTDIGGQNGGRIESSCKYIVWGIKLLLLIPQTYLSYLSGPKLGTSTRIKYL